MEDTTDTESPPKKTMFDFILWYNDIELKGVEHKSGVSYTTLFDLKIGKDRNFGWRTLNTVAKSISLEVDDFYDWKNKKHRIYGEEKEQEQEQA